MSHHVSWDPVTNVHPDATFSWLIKACNPYDATPDVHHSGLFWIVSSQCSQKPAGCELSYRASAFLSPVWLTDYQTSCTPRRHARDRCCCCSAPPQTASGTPPCRQDKIDSVRKKVPARSVDNGHGKIPSPRSCSVWKHPGCAHSLGIFPPGHHVVCHMCIVFHIPDRDRDRELLGNLWHSISWQSNMLIHILSDKKKKWKWPPRLALPHFSCCVNNQSNTGLTCV